MPPPRHLPACCPRAAALFCLLLAAACSALLPATSASQDSAGRREISGTELRGTKRLFGTDPRWVGCDVATSLKLADGRILWMFGESRIDPSSSGLPEKMVRLHNSVALQVGTDPETAELVHFWDDTDRHPASFFRDGRGFWYRPVDGLQVGSSLLILLFKVRTGRDAAQSEIMEWSVLRIANPQDSPARWRFQWLPTPANQWGAIVGFGGFVQLRGYVLTGARIPGDPDELLLVRWPLSRVVRNDFMSPEWWVSGRGWTPQEELSKEPSPVVSDVAGELAFIWDHAVERAFLVVSPQEDPGVIVALQAPSPTGPWSDPEEIFAIDADGDPASVSLSHSRGVGSGETAIAVVPVLPRKASGAQPRLYRLSSR